MGSYFLTPYLTRFDEALALAASQADGDWANDSASSDADADETVQGTGQAGATEQDESQPLKGYKKHYHLVRQEHVGMTAILLFARDPSAVRDVQVAHCGFGVADMGNKGAVGLRIAYKAAGGESGDGDESRNAPSELTFVATHLAAMEWNVRRRNANWRSIVAGLTFGNPKNVLGSAGTASEAAAGLSTGFVGRSHDEAASAPRTAEEEAAAEAAAAAVDDAWLLLGQQQHEVDVRRQLQDLSIFRPDSLLFVSGDLNYRIGDKRPPPEAEFPSASTWPAFLKRDQLTEERLAGRTFHGMEEAPISFPPTYKYDILSDDDLAAGVEPDNAEEISAWKVAQASSGAPSSTPPVPWQYATHRWPSWCDRVLFLDVPEWTKTRWSGGGEQAVPAVKVHAYKSLPLMATSDHQPVYFRAQVPLLGRALAELPEEVEEPAADTDGAPDAPDTTASAARVDPRLRLPVAIDTDAWDRRARARNRERMAGGGMLLFNTRAGALAMVMAMVVIAGLYWAWVGLV